MAELHQAERLQPCLLDRLTDDEPNATQESREKRVMSLSRYRAAVLRDLEWLFNARAPAARSGLEGAELVSASVLNYGLPDLCGMTASSLAAEGIERQVLEAIRNFEPRLLRHSLAVSVLPPADDSPHSTIAFEIRGELWAQPMPERLYIKTELDLETGRCQLGERTGG